MPDYIATKPPNDKAKPGAAGMDALPGTAPFIMRPDGLGWLFVPAGLVDGPLPTHYEPVESPVNNSLYKQQNSPVFKYWKDTGNELAKMGDPKFPYVMTTYRLTEHYLAGGMSRWLPWLNRAAARTLRRDQSRAGSGERHQESRLVQNLQPAHADPRQGAGHAADAAIQYRRQSHSPGRHALALGL